MNQSIDQFFADLWQNYVEITPSAKAIHDLLGNGAEIINDHVAFRTFNLDGIGLPALSKHMFRLGYEVAGEYQFNEKHLMALHFEHPDASKPKVFISELLVENLSSQAQAIIKKLAANIDLNKVEEDDFMYSGRHWDISSEDYQTLQAESEYAAWMSVWGFRANHFTVSVNALPDFETLESVNEALKNAGFVLNTSGGEIKGSADVYLEQSSTMADKQDMVFSDTTLTIPACFYEFARRFPLESGELYSGFVAASADKIFESTNAN